MILYYSLRAICCFFFAGPSLPAQTPPSSAPDPLTQTYRLSPGPADLEATLNDLVAAGAPLTFRNDQLPALQVNRSRRAMSLRRHLDQYLAGTGLTYRVTGSRVLVSTDRDLSGRTNTLSGYLFDQTSGERLIGAVLQDSELNQGTAANEFGFFSLTLPAGYRTLRATYLGYQPMDLSFLLQADTSLRIGLRPTLTLREVLVTASRSDSLPLPEISLGGTRIGIEESEQLGGPGGEADPLRTAHLLPGVTTGADGLGGLYLRGSDSGQNLILLDGVPVYNVNHAFGALSIFNSQVIGSVDLFNSAIPTQYGGRLAGVVDVRTRDGNAYRRQTQLETSLLAARVTTEGPLVKGESSYLISGRFFFMNGLLRRLSRNYKGNNGVAGETSYNLYDINVKLNHQLSKRDRVYFSFYTGLDAYENASERTSETTVVNNAGAVFRWRNQQNNADSVRWGNRVGALRWNHVFNERLFGNFTLTYSGLDVNAETNFLDSLSETLRGEVRQSSRSFSLNRSTIQDIGLRFDGQYSIRPGEELRFGADVGRMRFNTSLLVVNRLIENDGGEEVEAQSISQYPSQANLYAQYLRTYPSGFYYRLGLRGSRWHEGRTTFYNVVPRVLTGGRISKRVSWQSALDITQQPVHRLSPSVIGLPNDFLVPASAAYRPSRAVQLSSEIKVDWGTYAVSLAGYVKYMDRLIALKDGAALRGPWQNDVSIGVGRARGLELLLQRQRGRLRGWVSYTLAKAEREYDENLNFGNPFPFRYDRRHELKTALFFRLTERLQLSANWIYGSGAAYSFPFEFYTLPITDPDGNPSEIEVILDRERNGFRLPAYHRLDLNARWTIAPAGSRFRHVILAGVYNAYNRHNPVYYNYRANYQSRQGELDVNRQFTQVYVSPVLPSLAYRVIF